MIYVLARVDPLKMYVFRYTSNSTPLLSLPSFLLVELSYDGVFIAEIIAKNRIQIISEVLAHMFNKSYVSSKQKTYHSLLKTL